MHFDTTPIRGVVAVALERHEDERGFFARSWCRKEFEDRGLPGTIVQANVSFNRRAGTIRGMHFQLPPAHEGKVVRCTRGAIFDVAADLRCESATFLRSVSFELTESNYLAVYVPPGVAHGFQTLVDDTEVHYLMTDEYVPDLSSGVRWDDPALALRWPLSPTVISDRDGSYENLDETAFTAFRAY